MTEAEIIKKTEKYVKELMKDVNPDLHGFRHVNRVRKWAMKIGKAEGDVNLFHLELAALLHDIGRAHDDHCPDHCNVGGNMAKEYLRSLDHFEDDEIEAISRAVYEHGPGGESKLTKVLQDADRMDLWGAVHIARNFACWSNLQIYKDESSFEFKKISPEEIHRRCSGKRSEESVIDITNTLLNIYDNINTDTAKEFAREKIEFTKNFIKQLKKETIDI